MIKIFLLVFLLACGRYAPPVAPEYLAPGLVNNATMASESVVKLNWIASSKDVRGKKLKQIDGYDIYRRSASDEDYMKIGFVKDDHLLKLKKLQEQAKKSGQAVRKVRVPAEDLKFEYSDSKPIKKEISYYAIVPTNDSGVLGSQVQYFSLDPKGNKITPNDFGGIPFLF